MLTDTHDHVRVMAAGAMRLLTLQTRLIADDPQLIQACLQALHDSHPHVVMAATYLLTEVDSEEVDIALQKVLSHPNWWARLGAVDTLIARGCRAVALPEAIQRLLQECPYRDSLLVFVDETGNVAEQSIEQYLNELIALITEPTG